MIPDPDLNREADEIARFAAIVARETRTPGRRLIAAHARAGSPLILGPDGERRLNETFRLMWRTPPE